MLISTGKDFKITIHTANKGKFEYVRQINLSHQCHASSLDFMQGKILIGHDNGRICTSDLEGANIVTHNISHHDGESWGLEVIAKAGTFLTCGDDNQFLEYSIKDKKVLRSGKIWTQESNSDKPYETKKIKSTASTLCSYPAHQQGRCITYSPIHNHVAVSNNYGDISIFDYRDFSKKLTTLWAPKEWCEAMSYSPDGNYLAVGSHDDTLYIFSIAADGQYSLYHKIEYIHSSAITALDWSKDSKHLRAID
jgi:WD40 repeat protein